MPELVIALVQHSGTPLGAMARGEVISLKAQDTIRELPLMVGTPSSIQVDPGRYVVRASFPSGRTTTEEIEVSQASPAYVSLFSIPSAHEWLAWPTFTGEIAAKHDYDRQVASPRQRLTLWHRLWGQWRRSWTSESSWPSSWAETDNSTWSYGFQSGRSWLRALQVGGLDVPWRYTLLPPSDHVDVLIRPISSDALFERGVKVAVGTSGFDQAAEGFSAI